MIALLEEANTKQCGVRGFPRLALTTFFPRWYFESQADIDAFFEKEMPSTETQALFDRARELGVGFSLGFAKLTEEAAECGTQHWDPGGPFGKGHFALSQSPRAGHVEHEPWRAFQHLEKRYFERTPTTSSPSTHLVAGSACLVQRAALARNLS